MEGNRERKFPNKKIRRKRILVGLRSDKPGKFLYKKFGLGKDKKAVNKNIYQVGQYNS